jgi:hypothetical protein
VLTPEQYERYRDYQAWQSEMRANSLHYMQTATPNGSIPQSGGAVMFRAFGAAAPVAPVEQSR